MKNEPIRIYLVKGCDGQINWTECAYREESEAQGKVADMKKEKENEFIDFTVIPTYLY